MKRIRLFIFLLLAALGSAHATCRVTPQTTVPVDLGNGNLLVSVLVNGTPVIRKGEHTAARPGKVVYGPALRAPALSASAR